MNVWTKMPKALQRRSARWFARNPVTLKLEKPVISFTFDDFPKSALTVAGRMLREHGFVGTYYASFGLMGKQTPTGEIFSKSDLAEFIAQGHELACHTFDHCDSWDTEPAEFEASICRNQEFVARELPKFTMRSLSYPISYPRPATKRRVARRFACARAGGQTFNSGPTDLNYLKAFFIEQSRDNLDAIKRTIDDTVRASGWLIFATHDVCESPTRFGCTPAQFSRIVNYVAQSGAVVLPVSEALRKAKS